MRKSSITFSQIRGLLLDLGFSEARTDDHWRFEHGASGAEFLFRPYSPDENVCAQDLASTRMHLDWRDLLPVGSFDGSFSKTPA